MPGTDLGSQYCTFARHQRLPTPGGCATCGGEEQELLDGDELAAGERGTGTGWPCKKSIQASHYEILRRYKRSAAGKKRLGDRCVFRGGTNEPGAKFTYERKVKVRDEKGVWTGEMKTVTVSRTAVLGPAAQAQRLDFAAAWFEGRRKPAHLKSAEHMETLKCKKEKRDLERKEVVDAVEKYKETKVERPATAI